MYDFDNTPYALTADEWSEIAALKAIQDMWGLDPRDPDALGHFRNTVYAAKFHFFSATPGYVGDLFILQADVLSDEGPVLLRRDAGKLKLILEP